MKKLNLLKPSVKTGFLANGRGQRVEYLDIWQSTLNKEKLAEDIKNGASLYKELNELVKKKPSRVVVVNCHTREEGLIAAEYLLSIYNDEDGYNPDDYDYNEYGFTIEDDINTDEDDVDLECTSWEDETEWVENAYMVPIISASCLQMENSFNSIGMGGFGLGVANRGPRPLPYWADARHEPVIIWRHNLQYSSSFSDDCRRFERNRHLIIINILGEYCSEEEDDDEFDTDSLKNKDMISPQMLDFILDYEAECINVDMSDNAREKFLQVAFESIVNSYNYGLCSRFPVKKIVDKVRGYSSPNKLETMDKIIRYLRKRDTSGKKKLSEVDFDFLKLFKMEEIPDDQKSAKKLENNLVGMDSVKEQVRGIVDVMKYNKQRQRMGLSTGGFHNVHMLIGAPGTAKTTVAQFMGTMMQEEKLLTGKKFISINGSELKGMFVGHTAPKVKKIFEENDIIFIDEAYSICSSSNGEMDTYSQEAIAQLIIELESHGMDRLVLFAGYGGKNVSEKDNKMNEFLKSNPGIRSRINSTIFFESYTAEQMVEIFYRQADMAGYKADRKAAEDIKNYFATRINDRDFGNGREARSLLENATMFVAKRLSGIEEDKLTRKMLVEIKAEDIRKAINKAKDMHEMQRVRVADYGFAV